MREEKGTRRVEHQNGIRRIRDDESASMQHVGVQVQKAAKSRSPPKPPEASSKPSNRFGLGVVPLRWAFKRQQKLTSDHEPEAVST
ncbi:hypothetical protein E4U58_002050 [Claviceps cyperi]|nr:hypothetical protein E4U58_002050 [Claviceps cyperi]